MIIFQSHIFLSSDSSEKSEEGENKDDKERPTLPLETRMQEYRQMLVERQVSAFSTWDKELHKIVFDPRHTLLNPKERKQVSLHSSYFNVKVSVVCHGVKTANNTLFQLIFLSICTVVNKVINMKSIFVFISGV